MNTHWFFLVLICFCVKITVFISNTISLFVWFWAMLIWYEKSSQLCEPQSCELAFILICLRQILAQRFLLVVGGGVRTLGRNLCLFITFRPKVCYFVCVFGEKNLPCVPTIWKSYKTILLRGQRHREGTYIWAKNRLWLW